jgi:hypothetical protein
MNKRACPATPYVPGMKYANANLDMRVKADECSREPSLTPDRLALIKASALSISDMLDAAGLTPHEQLMCLRGNLILVLVAMSPEDRAQQQY